MEVLVFYAFIYNCNPIFLQFSGETHLRMLLRNAVAVFLATISRTLIIAVLGAGLWVCGDALNYFTSLN